MPGSPLAVSAHALGVLELIPLALVGLLYGARCRALAARGESLPAWRLASFYGGLGVIAVALAALGPTGNELLWVHTLGHLLLGDVGALLVVLGLTAPLLAPILRIPPLGRLGALSHPAVAFPLWALDLYAWHLPGAYQTALRHSSVHALQQLMLLGFGVNMWMCLFGPLPTPAWFGNAGKLAYILAVRLAGAALGNVFLWSGSIFYTYYLAGDARHHISPIADQNVAGAVMMLEGTILTLCLFYWLFWRTTREGEERRHLLDYAQARGVELSEARVARAVAAGRSAELRVRLEARSDARERFQQARSGAGERM
jgi:cytochrome c oxidase assembly factor CtaG